LGHGNELEEKGSQIMIKKSYLIIAILGVAVIAGLLVNAQQPQQKHDSMEGMNERGDKVMGFDHTKTTHHFVLKPDGGVIQIEANDSSDTASRDQIRQHMRHIAKMFAEGNFSAPMLIHEQNPPGADVMKELKARIKYEFGETERGAFIRMSTTDADGLKAIHDFLRFQIKEHMTGDPLEARSARQ
jgi:hypothetical protein